VANITLKDLFARLNPLAYRAAESAAIFCKTRGNTAIELEHLLHQVLMLQDSDLHRIIKAFDLNASRLASDLQAALDKLPRGATPERVLRRPGDGGQGGLAVHVAQIHFHPGEPSRKPLHKAIHFPLNEGDHPGIGSDVLIAIDLYLHVSAPYDPIRRA